MLDAFGNLSNMSPHTFELRQLFLKTRLSTLVSRLPTSAHHSRRHHSREEIEQPETVHCDNESMAIVPSGLVHQAQLDADIERAIKKIGPEAVHVSYRLDTDSTGEPSIFFRIVLAEGATGEDQLPEVTGRIAATLFDEIHPYENWGLIPYINYGSEAEWRKSEAGRTR